MIEENGQGLWAQNGYKPRGNYTGERLSVRKGQAIINALARGEPVERIARQLHTSKHTVMAIREREWDDIARRKQLIIASAARLAANGFDRLNAEMDAGNIKGSLLVPVTGMAIDKVIALSADAATPAFNFNVHAQSVNIAAQFEALHAAIEKAAKAKMIADSSAETGTEALKENR
jgi:hypothetical protein